MKLFDTHGHVFLHAKSDEEVVQVIDNFAKVGGEKILMPALDLTTSQGVVALCKKFPALTSAVGIHPLHAKSEGETNTNEAIDTLRKLILANKPFISAIGESGLDDHHTSRDPHIRVEELAAQMRYFEAQIALAKEFDLPIIVHSRNCPDLTLETLIKNDCKKCVIHCFSEDKYFAEKLFAFSDQAMISFTGLLTYPQVKSVQEVAASAPLHRIMIETDAPYLVPQNMRNQGVKECQSAYVAEVMEKLISLRSEPREVVIDTVWENSRRLFGV